MLKKRFLPVILILSVLVLIILYFGSTPPSPFYYLKIFRETIQTNFIFGTEDKARWLLTRADKRLTEAQTLKFKNQNLLAKMQIETAKQYQTEAQTLLNDLKDKTNTDYLKDKYIQNTDKINYLESH